MQSEEPSGGDFSAGSTNSREEILASLHVRRLQALQSIFEIKESDNNRRKKAEQEFEKSEHEHSSGRGCGH
jgi:hypothetical protein